jgi:hypothetical protein
VKAVDRIALAAGRVPGAVGREVSESWLRLSIYTRRRVVAALGLVAVIALIAFVAVPALPCQAPGGDSCPPADDAIHLVPADAIAYLHVNVDPDTDQFEAGQKVAARLPRLTQQAIGGLLADLPGPNGGPPDFSRDVRPWFGGEAAIALVPRGATTAEEIQLLEAADQDGARKFAEQVVSGKPHTSTYRDVDVEVDRRGLATAIVDGFLAVGRESGVRDVIDVQAGAKGTGSLDHSPAARAARDALPDERLADAYLSEDGIARFVSSSRAPLGSLAAVVDPGASRGVAAALVATDDGLEAEVRSLLDPARAKAHPGFFSAFPAFAPELPGALQPATLAYLGIGAPGKTLQSLLEQAAAAQPGLAAAVGGVVHQVRKLGNVNLERDLLPSLGGEAAFALEPSPARGAGAEPKHGGGEAAGRTALPGFESPFLEFVGAAANTGRASKALARLEGPIAKALRPSRTHQAPVFGEHQVGETKAQSLRLSPTVNLTYAIVNSLLVIATDPAGVEDVVAGKGGLSGVDSFDQATDGLPGTVSLLGYLNLQDLVALGEAAGLAEDPAYATFASEVRSLHALGLAVQASPEELSTDARLVVGEPALGGGEGAAPSD